MKIVIAIIAFVLIAGVCFAQEHTPMATEPIGAVIETTGVFLGKIIAGCEEAFTGERTVTMDTTTGDTKVFPFNNTVELVDKGVDIVTLGAFKAGDDVTVKVKNMVDSHIVSN